MIPELEKTLKQYNVDTLQELSKELKISLDKIKNISCGRTSFSSLFRKRIQYRILPRRSEELSELIGIVLGDGNIYRFPRCQRLTISCNGSYKHYVTHISHLVRRVLKKEPSVIKRSRENCIDVCLYMQEVNRSLGLPVGNKIKNSVTIPKWIFGRRQYLTKCVKGLFETDGHYGSSKKFHVEYIQFCNESESLRKSVFRALESLGYSPQLGNNYIRIARKNEVREFIKEMHFERPFPSLLN